MNQIAQRPPVPNVEEMAGVATFRGFEWIFENIVTVILGFAGIVLFVMLIIGGIKYITSGGNPERAQAAGKTLTYAIGGLILIALSYLIIFSISKLTGVNLTIFKIYNPN